MLRSNSKSLGNHVVSPEEEKERLQWERFAEKKAHVKIASRIVSYRIVSYLYVSQRRAAATCIRVLFSSWGAGDYWEERCADRIGTGCFPGLAISNAAV